MDRVQPSEAQEDDWEIVNDDGFVYKRKKRRLSPTITAPPPPPPPDPAIAEKKRRERKKKTLLKIKEKYQKELSQWELFSNTLRAMEIKAKPFQDPRQDHAPTPECESSNIAPEKISGQVLDELLLQVEAQEAIIQDVSNMCDLAETLCNTEEEKSKQSFLMLPIWDYSPRELMTSLCED